MDLKEKRAIKACVHTAGFPFEKTINDFDFSFQPSINKNEIEDYTSLRFMENNENRQNEELQFSNQGKHI